MGLRLQGLVSILVLSLGLGGLGLALLTRHLDALSLDHLNDPTPQPDQALPQEVHQLSDGIGRLQHALAGQLADREAATASLAAQ